MVESKLTRASQLGARQFLNLLLSLLDLFTSFAIAVENIMQFYHLLA